MQRIFHCIRRCMLLWGLLPFLFGSCSFGDEPSPCPYDIRLEVTVYDDNRVVVTQASAADWEEIETRDINSVL